MCHKTIRLPQKRGEGFSQIFDSLGKGAKTRSRLAACTTMHAVALRCCSFKLWRGDSPEFHDLETPVSGWKPFHFVERSRDLFDWRSHVIRSRRYPAAAAGPVGVEELATRLVDAFVGVGSEEVTLRLKQVGGQAARTVAVKEGECG